MSKKILPIGTVIKIIGAEHSGPVGPMHKLIGKRGKITERGSDGHYKAFGWWWSPLDFEVKDIIEFQTEFLFDAKNLVIEDSNV